MPRWRQTGREQAPADRDALPLPPPEMRRLVGPTDQADYENDSERPLFGLPEELFEQVLDFGCGCGRLARQMIQQRSQPRAYLGIDIHRGMVRWAKRNLTPHAPQFRFEHHDVFNVAFNPGRRKPSSAPLPAADASQTLVLAHSVFTHLAEEQARHYLAECSRVLRDGGLLYSTWFLFDKTAFPMMQEDQNALYINLRDPTNAVIFDRAWLRGLASSAGLTMTEITAPQVRGFQWVINMRPARDGLAEAEFPADAAEPGVVRAPQAPERPWEVG